MFSSTSSQNEYDPSFLQATELIQASHSIIVQKAHALIQSVQQPDKKARSLFYFIRDHIRYVFHANLSESDYQAITILKKGKGFCTQKAILFCALARAVGIPAGIHFYDIVDHTLPAPFVKLLGTNTLFNHGVTALYLNGRWIQYDATLDSQLIQSHNLESVEFSPEKDCLMKPFTLDGRHHVDYIRDHGLRDDVRFEEIRSWLQTGYPHLFQSLSNE
jgi:transglutaminase-like putative cysteine protease